MEYYMKKDAGLLYPGFGGRKVAAHSITSTCDVETENTNLLYLNWDQFRWLCKYPQVA